MVPDSWLRTYIEQYAATCPLCRVPLHPQWDQCLRCRRKVQLGLKVLQPYLIAWGLTVCLCALQSGMGILLLYVLLRNGELPRDWNALEVIFFVIGILGLLTTLGIALALLFRRRFCAMPHILQWLAVALSAAILLTSSLLTMAYIR